MDGKRHGQCGQDSKSRSPSYLQSLLQYKRRKHKSINRLSMFHVNEPSVQISAHRTSASTKSAGTDIRLLYAREAATLISMMVVKLHFCLDCTGHVSFHIC